MEPKVIVIVGPTCSGKTDLSLILAEKLNTEIISADSRQIYKYLNIGTAKPGTKILKKIKHHFIDILNPDDDYNVSKFENDSLKIIERLLSGKKIPVVVGGSGLYIKALIDGIFNSAEADHGYRKYLTEQKKLFGNEYLYEELKKIDPESAKKMLPQNWKRIIRALEVFHLSGKTIGYHQKEYSRNLKINFRQYGISWEREVLYKRIEARVDEMIEKGLISEVEKIIKKGYSKNLNSLNTVGYKEIISYLSSEISLEKAIELIKRNTRRFAKRQLTWFRKDKRIIWFEIKSLKDLLAAADKIIKTENPL